MTEQCGAVGALMVGGRVVGQLRCELDAGHDSEAAIFGDEWMPHRMTLEWMPEAEPDLDLLDPHEVFDVDVPIVESGVCLVPGCDLAANHDGLHDVRPDE